MKQRQKWAELRHSYYSSARNELLLGNYNSAGILFGYAVETSMKHALIESGFEDRNVLHKHEPEVLLKSCRKQNILEDLEVSNDFLDYINDHFKPRYPSLNELVNSDIQAKNRFKTFGPLLLSWYDDILFEIDCWITEFTKDNLSSVFFRATGNIDKMRGRLFFHANYHACTYLDQLIEMRQNHQGDNSYIVSELQKGIGSFWSSVPFVTPAQRFENVNYEKNFSKRFHYPKWSDEDEPSVSITNANCIVINMLPWEPPPN